ncbi:HAD family hydrolase [Amaricoccus sp.]|uniref:HAD family hydrolase n=1 Tax=Amaricoccus sp. TaxID=1872485 RepID=UPI001B72F9CC|nr:HAD family hydrolase [Amaricoccus sp.]MBP7242019.1 HAD family hydrolase [Amaricoccus sp.]
MQPPEPIRGLVFDKDGTLFDFQATWGIWCADFVRELAGADPARADALAAALGFDRDAGRFHPQSPVIAGTMEVVIAAALNALPGLDEAGLRRRVLETTAAAPQVEAAPLAPLLDRLRAAGLTLGLATNDAEGPARAHLGRAGVLDRFAFVAGYDSGHGGKPEPGMLEAFCRATGLPPSACAMVGDSAHDLASGRAAGMTTIGVLTGPATAEELAPLADVVLPGVAALPAWLGLDA